MEEFTLRAATPDDSSIIAHHRAAMFQDMGLVSPGEFEQLRQTSEPWIADVLAKKQYAGWLIEHQKTVVAGGGVLLREQFPVPGCYRIGIWAHVVNVYTVPAYRKRGLARKLMQHILAWCESQNVDQLTLAASDEGRPLYTSLGFKPTNDMRFIPK